MARNKLSDLNDHLFAQIERLTDNENTDTCVDLEVSRSKALTQLAGCIVNTHKIVLDAVKFSSEEGKSDIIPSTFGVEYNETQQKILDEIREGKGK